MAHQLYPNGDPAPARLFDVRWRHFHSQLSLEEQQRIPPEAGATLQVVYICRWHYFTGGCARDSSCLYIQISMCMYMYIPFPLHERYILYRINNSACIILCKCLAITNWYALSTQNKGVNSIWHDMYEKFEHASELKAKLVVSFEDKLPPLSGLECGYLHKGSKRWIENDN